VSTTFEAEIRQGTGGGAFIEVPDEVIAALGGGGRIKVKATFDGVPYRGSIARYRGVMMLGVVKAIREQIGKSAGDTVAVRVSVDREERTVETPPELEEALTRSKTARAFYDSLSYTCRKEYARWVGEAKRSETRERRAARALEMLEGGRKL
jgi:hypothetical protein